MAIVLARGILGRPQDNNVTACVADSVTRFEMKNLEKKRKPKKMHIYIEVSEIVET